MAAHPPAGRAGGSAPSSSLSSRSSLRCWRRLLLPRVTRGRLRAGRRRGAAPVWRRREEEEREPRSDVPPQPRRRAPPAPRARRSPPCPCGAAAAPWPVPLGEGRRGAGAAASAGDVWSEGRDGGAPQPRGHLGQRRAGQRRVGQPRRSAEPCAVPPPSALTVLLRAPRDPAGR